MGAAGDRVEGMGAIGDVLEGIGPIGDDPFDTDRPDADPLVGGAPFAADGPGRAFDAGTPLAGGEPGPP